MRAVVLALAALALAGCLAGCESSQEKSARLEKAAKHQAAQAAARRKLAERGLTISRPSRLVEVKATVLVRGSEQTAAAVTVRNSSARAMTHVPIAITVKDAHGASLYTNATPGLSPTLVSLPYLPAHATLTWVDDQVQTSSPPASLSAEVGEGQAAAQAQPRLQASAVRLGEGEVEGSLVNRTATSASEAILYVIARRAGKIVAAGSAVVASVEASSQAHFQAFLVGDAKGAQLEVNVGGAA